MEEELSTSQVEEGEIVLDLFLPAHQKSAGAMEQAMGAIHGPTTRGGVRMQEFESALLAATADMSIGPSGGNIRAHNGIVVARIQAQVLGRVSGRYRSASQDRFYRHSGMSTW